MGRSAVRLAALAAAVAACAEVPAPRRCASGADCAADARCIQEVCVADAPPVAVITAPASFLSNVSYAFGSAASYDTDAGDAVVARQWTVAAAQAACQPSPDAAATESLTVVFPCAGSFDVKLVVTDRLGVASAPAVVRVQVTQSVDPPLVTVGPDLALDHRCAGLPLVCTPVDQAQVATFALSASATGPAAGGFAYKWRYELPPELAGKPAPTVVFAPNDASPSPVVAVQTQGTAIAGSWKFVVEAKDSRGLVAVGTQQVIVGNRPPVISGAGAPLIAVPHVFTPSAPGAATGTMAAVGTTPVLTVTDPDGDPFEAAFSSSHSGDGANAFLVQDLGSHASFSVVVLYGGPADGPFLIGPVVSRAIAFNAIDVNGGAGTARWDIQVTNRPPRVVAPVTALGVPHAFDPAGSRYLASASLATFADDDGDPLTLDGGTGDPICTGRRLSPATPAAAEVECAVPYVGKPAANAIAGLHVVTATVRDAWASASAPTNLTIGNRPPRLATKSIVLTPACTQGACCSIDPFTKTCQASYVIQSGVTEVASSPLIDEDGDPVLVDYTVSGSCVSVSPTSELCGPAGCSLTLSLCGHAAACSSTYSAGNVSATMTDGDLSATDVFTVSGACANF